MLRRSKLAIPGVLMLAAAAAALWPQPALPQQEQKEGPTVFTSDTRLVVCHTTVTDRTGHLVTSLTKDQFTVLEDGKPQEIKVFRREDIPVSLGLIIDNSGSMRDKRAKVEAA